MIDYGVATKGMGGSETDSANEPDFQALFDATPGRSVVVLPDAPRYTIVAVTDAYVRARMTTREQLLGRGLVGLLPEYPAGDLAASLERAVMNHVPDAMPVLEIESRWCCPTNYPVLGPGGEVLYIIHVVEDVTETRRLQEENALFDQASECIFIADASGRYIDVNAAACGLLGYSRNELIGKTTAELVSSEDLLRLAATRELLMSFPGTVDVAEWTLLRKDGTRVGVEVSAKILPDGRSQAFVRDVTERKRIDAELRDAKAFLDAIIENIPLMLFLKESTTLRFVRFNRAGESLLGWSRQALVGKSDFDFWPREQAEYFVARDRETMKRGEVLDIPEEPIQTRHHGLRILHTKKVPILDASGSPLYLLGISEDITERKQLEDERRLLADASVALSASLDYEQTLATVTDLAVRRVCDWCFVDLIEEPGHLRRLKVASADPADAALCAELERLPANRDLPHVARRVIETQRSIVVEQVTPEYIESVAQGREHAKALLATGVTSFLAVPLLLRGRALGVIGFGSRNGHRIYRVGDLRWAEALADRSAMAIENARLYRDSVQATQLREQVLGVVAHDLRNPLFATLMQESRLRARHGSTPELDAIRRAATRMMRLVQDLLDVSLMEAGQLVVEKARVSASELVVEAAESQKWIATAVDLQIDVSRGTDEVWGDRDRLLQVFENLIGNAIRFTPPGGHITVGAESREHEVIFWVADDGSGIAPDGLPHLFERFWQATKGDRRGAGLGLPIVKGIVEAHGGHIWVESTLGRGSTFFFSIPRAHPTADQPSGLSA
jgi:PAS domain S-box-containing protein